MSRDWCQIPLRVVSLALVAGCGMLDVGGCGPEAKTPDTVELPSEAGRQYAHSVCAAFEVCGCAPSWASDAECRDEFQARFDRLIGQGLRVSEACFQQWRSDIEDDPCRAQAVGEPGEPLPCFHLRGTKAQGAACEAHLELVALYVDECQEGLMCRNARCAEARESNVVEAAQVGEGELCGPTQEAFCAAAPNLYCDAHEGVCRAIDAREGEPCVRGGCISCSDDGGLRMYCEGADDEREGICQPVPSLGEPCDPATTLRCGDCEREGWCDPSNETCVEATPPLLCRWLFG